MYDNYIFDLEEKAKICFNLYLPLGRSYFNGHISGFSLRKSELSGTSMLDFPCVGYSSEIQTPA